MWLNKLSKLYWILYLLLGILISISANYLFNILNVQVTSDSFFPAYALNLIYGFIPAYDLIILALIPKHISKDLHEFRPALDISNSEFYNLYNRILYSPISNKNLLVLSFFMFFSILLALLMGFFGIGGFEIILSILFLLMLLPSFLVIYKTSSILWHIYRLQNQPLKINILDTYPLLSLSRLTQKIAIYLLPITTILGILGINFIFVLKHITRDLSYLEIAIGTPVIFSGPLLLILSVCIFIFPVLWVRRLIIEKKKQALSDIATKLLSSFFEHDRLIAIGDLSNINAITTSINTLNTRNETYKKISEFPWEGRVLREFLGALVVPIILWIAQFYLGQFFNELPK